MTGVGLGPEVGTGALGVPKGLGDKAGRGVVRAASVELRPSVGTGGVALVWALTEAQQSRSRSRSGRTPSGPMARLKAAPTAAGTARCLATVAARRGALREGSREAARDRGGGGRGLDNACHGGAGTGTERGRGQENARRRGGVRLGGGTRT